MGDYTVERDWTTEAGFRAVVIMGSLGHRCGYVGVPAEHPLHGAAYGEAHPALTFPEDEQIGKRGLIPLICSNGEARPDVVFDVHGGLTYSGSRDAYPVPSEGLWWFGYDCGHAGDARDPDWIARQPDQVRDLYRGDYYDQVRDLDYCVDECESLARQLVERVSFAAPHPTREAGDE